MLSGWPGRYETDLPQISLGDRADARILVEFSAAFGDAKTDAETVEGTGLEKEMRFLPALNAQQ